MLIRLPKNSGLAIGGDCRDIVIRCQEGVVWLTQTGDRADYFLAPRQEFTIRRRGKVIVEARQDACVMFVAPEHMSTR